MTMDNNADDRALKDRAAGLLREFKGERYVFGLDRLDELGPHAAPLGRRCLLVTGLDQWNPDFLRRMISSLRGNDITVTRVVPGARPNAPREDVSRLTEIIIREVPDFVLAADGGSGIDAVKAAVVLAGLGGDVEDYFGVGKVTQALDASGKSLMPVLAVQTAASSAAHLTKYSNITDLASSQKKLIVDEAVVPARALFDYSVTTTMPGGFTLDGAFDGIAHSLEVFYGAGADGMGRILETAETGIELIVSSVEAAAADGRNMAAREALGLGTDLGGYAIMMGGTNGAHLTSFSLVDILSHGRACAIMNPYYTVFFGPAIQPQLRILAGLYEKHGLMDRPSADLGGKDLALAVAGAMIKLARRVGFPTTLGEVEGFSQAHIARALAAAKNPQLEMKLRNMPIALTGDMVDGYMGPVLRAAATGDFGLIQSLRPE